MTGFKNSRIQGNLGLATAIHYYARKGYTVCIPLTDTQPFDLTVDDGVTTRVVQVKSTAYKPGAESGYHIQLRRIRCGRVVHDSLGPTVTHLFVVCDDGRLFEIPVSLVKDKTAVVIGGEKYKPYQVE